MKDKILILYAELGGYTVTCFNYYLEKHLNAELHVVRLPLNSEAPFQFKFNERLITYNRPDYSVDGLKQLIGEINPEVIICCGWWDKQYLQAIRAFKGQIKSVLMFDNYWESSIKQQIGQFILPRILHRTFDLCWVPGEIQSDYAQRLGFKPHQIFTGFYSNDMQPFLEQFNSAWSSKEKKYPHAFLYVGRYLTLKGVEDLWSAFVDWKSETDNDWILYCVGMGELYDQRVKHDAIHHLGFLEGKALVEAVDRSGVFVMPSHYDHWGMAVHEFASAGLPLLCSSGVGAASMFLQENKNGKLFKPKDRKGLKACFQYFADLSDAELLEMSKISNEKSKHYDLDNWNDQLNRILKFDYGKQ